MTEGGQRDVLPPVRLSRGRTVPDAALRERSSTSGGPGGQHVNRSATRIELRVRVADLPLSEREHVLLQERLSGKITRSGELVVHASSERSQLHNRKDARRRLEQLLLEALTVDPARVPTKVPRGVVQRIRAGKRLRSARKAGRRWRPTTDDE